MWLAFQRMSSPVDAAAIVAPVTRCGLSASAVKSAVPVISIASKVGGLPSRRPLRKLRQDQRAALVSPWHASRSAHIL